MKIIDEEILKAYDRKKGTAVKEVNALPSTVENRIYIVDGKIYVKSTEIATKELLTTDDDINTLSSEYSKTMDEFNYLSINDTGIEYNAWDYANDNMNWVEE